MVCGMETSLRRAAPLSEIVGKPVRLNEYDQAGRAKVEFTDSQGVLHFIYVSPDIISIT